MKMTVEQAIKNAIKGKGITLDNAAVRLGMSRRTLYNHIGAAKIDPMFIQKVYTILKIDINQIIEDTTGPYKNPSDTKGLYSKPVADYGNNINADLMYKLFSKVSELEARIERLENEKL